MIRLGRLWGCLVVKITGSVVVYKTGSSVSITCSVLLRIGLISKKKRQYEYFQIVHGDQQASLSLKFPGSQMLLAIRILPPSRKNAFVKLLKSLSTIAHSLSYL
jgi:hypothetical protein